MMTIKEAIKSLEEHLNISIGDEMFVGSGTFINEGAKIIVYSDSPPSNIPSEWEGYKIVVWDVSKALA